MDGFCFKATTERHLSSPGEQFGKDLDCDFSAEINNGSVLVSTQTCWLNEDLKADTFTQSSQ